jgi:hypothetical protein
LKDLISFSVALMGESLYGESNKYNTFTPKNLSVQVIVSSAESYQGKGIYYLRICHSLDSYKIDGPSQLVLLTNF